MSSSLRWIRRSYNVPAYQGIQVIYRGKPATVAGGRSQYIRLRVDGAKRAVVTHPVDGITYPTLPLPASPRGWCRHCMTERALRKDGTVVRHQRPDARSFPVAERPCPGAGDTPWNVCAWTVPPDDERPRRAA